MAPLAPCPRAGVIPERRQDFGVVDRTTRSVTSGSGTLDRFGEWPLGISIVAPQQWTRQAVGMHRIVPAVAALDTQPPGVDRAVSAFRVHDLVVH